jgi:hypothetical protein
MLALYPSAQLKADEHYLQAGKGSNNQAEPEGSVHSKDKYLSSKYPIKNSPVCKRFKKSYIVPITDFAGIDRKMKSN